jgi:class 3 adenylate cyclase
MRAPPAFCDVSRAVDADRTCDAVVVRLPETHYATTDGLRIAYQKWGSGPPCLIVPALISNIEIHWEHELYRRTLERLGQFLTCAYFDKRGIGLSDRFDEMPTLEQRIQDIVCVMDTVGWDRAHVLGVSEGGMMGQLFAADFPDRVESLGVLNSTMTPKYRHQVRNYIEPGDAPFPRNQDITDRFLKIADSWSEDPSFMISYELPSQIGNEAVSRWISRLQRFSCTPNDFRRQLDSLLQLDAGDAPERIQARTLVMHVKGDRVLPVAIGRLLARLIPDATYVEFPGDDHFAWCMANWREIVDTYVEFATGAAVRAPGRRRFATVLFTDIVDSTRQSAAVGDVRWRTILESHDRVTRDIIDHHGGRVVKSTGDGVMATFDMPSDAVSCGVDIVDALTGIGLAIRAGAHAGEIEVRDDGDVAGIGVHLAARIEQLATPGEFWVSSTIRDVMLGGDITFTDLGQHELKGLDDGWRLFSVAPA